MSTAVIAPLLVALVTAIATLLTRTNDTINRGVSLLGGVGYFAAVALLFQRIVLPLGSEGQTLVYQVSGWKAPFGIVLVADPLSAFMLALTAIVSLCALTYSVLFVDGFGQRLSYHPLYHFMVVGVTGSFLTGDIFNLFVWFEVMLMSSYILVLFYSGPEHTRAALNYVVLNLLGSAVMLLAIGGLYATTGTLNMADLARRLADPATYDVAVAPVIGLAAVLFSVFALKAGIVPFQFWVPAAYRAAPAPVTAMLAGVVKKVGVYAIVRLYFTVFAAASLPVSLPFISGDSMLAFFGPVFFVMATASIVVGGVGAIGREDIDGLLAYSSISQVGFIILPFAVAAMANSRTVQMLGVTAGIVYAFNHGLAKSLLFLASGTIQEAVGTARFDQLGGLARRAPVLSAGFLLGALTLIGVPPLSGFFGKLLVFQTAADAFALDAIGAGAALIVALVGAVLTIAYYTRAWNDAFWGAPGSAVEAAIPSRWTGPVSVEADESAVADAGGRADGGTANNVSDPPASFALTGQVVVVAALAVTVIAFGIGFDAVYQTATTAAKAALNTEGYMKAVLGSVGALVGVVA
ncbi:formate hydrogenlyase subunit 3/multisubunit Na+/H+ antiporter subunit MnhD [Halogeometricum borinquense DSM 11551]|uniref:Formate hydrogenlyase subunit 3/multisubunit Na+/H+ antiporter subunit MnhD n=1 Tax=Halogeometricum borinquense (strain ATCC 700274 / DSM 11551 / JCM 10706 / KCTC 4070 / PR3) TaxID=469382 RepID=E4NQD9_HALBP|nr:Na+/H+ antiporter subunit D [Halogeometricum borinquense]ADQ67812.1 formate hydrogenlyase subunit 3/multisubunit Na+/H+ antiporter, MnhD subunit [Halogeometricum borinquense DSM 11551]ELY23506.1 formate hydrogenlyase subunit 3/multisubunit Na+/H+ antiporter subunit MnhD [Halogeometricum borinquense DSM 11551]